MFQHTRQPKMETQCMTKQQAPHSPERCAGVPGHKNRRGGKPFHNPLPAARHPRHKAVASYCKKITADD